MQGCVRSADLTRLFSATFSFLQDVLLKFGFRVTIGELGYNRAMLQSYRTSFKDFAFIIKAISQIEGTINEENEVDQEKLVITSDIRKKKKCKDILDLKENCEASQKRGLNCLTEEEARGLINYMIIQFMVDSKRIIAPNVIDGKISCIF